MVNIIKNILVYFLKLEMSLYVGNISPRVRHSELERVFQRFGQSNLELKDGYGFVVYDVVRDAEKALRALKGRLICGEQLSITWSRKQKPLRRFSGKNSYERAYVNRDLKKEENIKRKYFQEREESTEDIQKHKIYEVRAVNKDGFIHKRRDDCFENNILGEKGNNRNLEVVLHERGSAEPIPLENDRWGEPLSDASNEHDMAEETTDMQHYDPYSAGNRDGGDACESGKHPKTKSNDSYAANSSPERFIEHRSRDEAQIEHGGFRKSPERCYKCGRMGHVMRHCHFNAVVSRMDKFERIGLKRNGQRNFRKNGVTRCEFPRESDWSKRVFPGDAGLQRKDFSTERTMGHAEDRKHHHHRTERWSEYKRKQMKQLPDNRKEDDTRIKTGKRHKRLWSGSISQPTGGRHKSHSSSPCTESQNETYSKYFSSHSRSSISKSCSSRSVSPLHSSHSNSPPSSPHSESRSPGSLSMSSHPRSQSVSSSRSAKLISNSGVQSATPRSLSVLLSPCVKKSPVLIQSEHDLYESHNVSLARQSVKNVLSFESQCAFAEEIRQENGDNAFMERDVRLAVKIENGLRVKVIQDDEKQEADRNINDSGNFFCYERGITSIDREDNSHLNDAADKHNGSEGDIIMEGKMTGSSALEDAELQVDATMQPVVNHSRTAHEKGDESLLGKFSMKSMASISLQEVKMIVEYSKGLPIEKIEHKSSTESYLGAARLWPWEVILYRRFKRGAISVANYARRMAQNEMFGIVDKYVRSSSGWWENETHEF